MPKEPKLYRRLAGRGTTLAHYVRLFQGPDHLLQVSSTGYTELYKRFYFRDVQAIIIRKTQVGIFWTILWIVLASTFLLPALGFSGTGAVILWSIAAVFLTCLMVHLILGPTCVCHIRTAVQVERLPTLRRIKAARRTVERIKPLIIEAQRPLAEEREKMHPAAAPGNLPETAPAQENMAAPPIISSADSASDVKP